MDAVLDAVPSKVTAEMNVDLCKPYLDEEIAAALFQMGQTKVPGPDGFLAFSPNSVGLLQGRNMSCSTVFHSWR
jgi:hypothetical protein